MKFWFWVLLGLFILWDIIVYLHMMGKIGSIRARIGWWWILPGSGFYAYWKWGR